MVKLYSLPLLALSLVACGADFRTIKTDPVCTPYPWFLDADGDGWGDPTTTGVVLCSPNDATGFTAANNRDCDDADASVTAQAGSICPPQVVSGTGHIAQFEVGSAEYLITNVPLDAIDGSSVVWPEYADDVCGSSGWGGTNVVETDEGIQEEVIDTAVDTNGLIVIDSPQELTEIGAQIEGTAYWAGWIRAVPDDPAAPSEWVWGDIDANGDVVPLIAPGLDFSQIGGGFCEGVSVPPLDPALHRLALIKRTRGSESELCLGNPEIVWGRYFKDVQTSVDSDGDGLPTSDDPDPNDFDADDDGIGDGQEFDVLGTDPDGADEFPVLNPGVEDPQIAFQTELAYFVCERVKPAPERWAMHDLPGL